MQKKTTYRLMSIDLDGTLLSPLIRIASKTDCLALQDYMAAGGVPFINTGRAPGATINTVDRVNSFGPNKINFISCLNGAYIKDFNDGEVIEHKISHEYSKCCLDLVKQLKYKNLYLWFHLPRSVKTFTIEIYPLPWWHAFYPFGEVVPIRDEKDLSAYKLDVICANAKKISKLYKLLIDSNLHKVVNITRSSKRLIEITPKDIDKGKALDYFANKYGISKNSCCAVGDTFNDLSAFEHSALSIGIKPRNPDLAAKVNYVIPTKRNGVANAINNYLLKDKVDADEFKIIFSDLDGTLIDGKTKLFSMHTKVALQQCANHSIPIAIASGRTIYDGIKFAEMMELNPKTNVYIIGNNGATIYDMYTKKYISETPISTQEAKEVFNYLTELVKRFNGEGGFMIHQKSTQNIFYNQPFWEKTNLKKTGKKDLYDPWATSLPFYVDKYPEDIVCYKMFFKFPNHEAALAGNKELAEKFPNLQICLSSPVNVEVNAKGVHKGFAVTELSKLTNIPVDNFIALGDSQNDIPALSMCKHSYVPDFAHEFVKKEAHHVVENVSISNFASTVIYQTIFKK